MNRRRQPDAGITLIEIMVAMAIFGLIGTAGFTMLDQTLRARSQTEGRLERLGAVQRSMYLINLDLLQAEGHSLLAGPDPQGMLVALRRPDTGGSLGLRYVLREGFLLRELGSPPDTRVQTLLDGIDSAALRFRAAGDSDWRATWPPEPPPQGKIAANPQAVEFTLTFAGTEGSIRRVVVLPDGMP